MDAIEQIEAFEAIDAAELRLPELERMIFQMHYRHEIPVAECAGVLGLEPDVADEVLTRATRRVRALV